ncbi:MAG: DUF1002 domain-containing protein [Oscillospiraceae bacterium]
MKKIISILLLLCLTLALCVPALAVNEGEERVVIGADLGENDILTVYGQFGLMRGSVTELKVTNAEERNYLEGIVSESVIGTRSISCIYIKTLSEGAGLTVSTNNISWCTQDMYKSALMTAGIFDAEVKVGAPFSVSGTAALTGIYKAYEDITGEQLDEEAKAAAADELVITAELADAIAEAGVDMSGIDTSNVDVDQVAEEISNADAVSIVNELKLILDETKNMSDGELREQIILIADSYGYTLDEDLINRLIELCRSMEGLSIADLTDKVEQFKNGVATVQQYAATVQEYAEKATSFGQKVSNFFRSIADFFSGLFGK